MFGLALSDVCSNALVAIAVQAPGSNEHDQVEDGCGVHLGKQGVTGGIGSRLGGSVRGQTKWQQLAASFLASTKMFNWEGRQCPLPLDGRLYGGTYGLAPAWPAPFRLGRSESHRLCASGSRRRHAPCARPPRAHGRE